MVIDKRYSTLLYSIYEMNEIDQTCVFLADFETLVWADSYYLIEEDKTWYFYAGSAVFAVKTACMVIMAAAFEEFLKGGN